MQRDSRSKAPELLTDMRAHVTAALVELVSMQPDAADHVSREVVQRMASHWGGQNIYFPMGLSVKLSARDHQLFDEFDGTNHGELARKYGVSLQWVYKIVKQVRAEQLRAKQGTLFDDGAG